MLVKSLLLFGLIGFVLGTYYGPVRFGLRRMKCVHGRGMISRSIAGWIGFLGWLLVLLAASIHSASR
jgi:hypothetical protein